MELAPLLASVCTICGEEMPSKRVPTACWALGGILTKGPTMCLASIQATQSHVSCLALHAGLPWWICQVQSV